MQKECCGVVSVYFPNFQVPLLSKCLYCELFFCLVELDSLGTGNRLDGNEWYKSSTGFQWPGGNLAKSKLLLFGSFVLIARLFYLCAHEY